MVPGLDSGVRPFGAGVEAGSQAKGKTMKLYERINGPWHSRALVIVFSPIFFHMFEHVLQVFQVYVLNIERADALGLLGIWLPRLMRAEVIHFGFSVYTLLAILVLGGAIVGRARWFGLVALSVQSWHLFEHTLLLTQRSTDNFFFGTAGPSSLVELLIPRVELHFAYNATVFTCILVAMLLHAYPPRGETVRPRCGCARQGEAEAELVAA